MSTVLTKHPVGEHAPFHDTNNQASATQHVEYATGQRHAELPQSEAYDTLDGTKLDPRGHPPDAIE